MSMITPNIPPGTIIPEFIFKDLPIGQINFDNKCPKTPLSPLVEARYSEENNVLNVYTILFLDASIGLPTFTVYQNYTIDGDGEPLLQFFLVYDHQETEAKVFNAFQLNFQVNASLLKLIDLSEIKKVQTFLWDKDPMTSRGTVTTVQRS